MYIYAQGKNKSTLSEVAVALRKKGYQVKKKEASRCPQETTFQIFEGGRKKAPDEVGRKKTTGLYKFNY